MEQADPSMTEVPLRASAPRANAPPSTTPAFAPVPAPPAKRTPNSSEMSITMDESPASRAFVESAMRGSPTPSQKSAAAARNGDGESQGISTVLKMLATAIRSLENTVNRRLDSVESILARSMSEGKSNLKPLHQTIESSANNIGAVQIMLDMLAQNAKDTGQALQTLQESISSKVVEVAAPVVAESPASAVSTAVGLSVAESHAPSKQDGGSAFIGGPSEYMVIMPDEFEKIQRDRNLKHIWVFMNYKDGEPARKIRVSGITVEEIQYVYSKGGAVYPFSKTCEDWDAFIGARNRYFQTRNRC